MPFCGKNALHKFILREDIFRCLYLLAFSSLFLVVPQTAMKDEWKYHIHRSSCLKVGIVQGTVLKSLEKYLHKAR